MAQLQFDIVKNLDARLTTLFNKAEGALDIPGGMNQKLSII
jgi:hypothetical protein